MAIQPALGRERERERENHISAVPTTTTEYTNQYSVLRSLHSTVLYSTLLLCSSPAYSPGNEVGLRQSDSDL